jgi:hypothetical protein
MPDTTSLLPEKDIRLMLPARPQEVGKWQTLGHMAAHGGKRRKMGKRWFFLIT